MKNNVKLIYWLIWIIGLLTIGATDFFCHRDYVLRHLDNFLFVTLFSSIPFGVLAIFFKRVVEDTKTSTYDKDVKFSEITGAFIVTCVYAIWSFSASMKDALNPAGFFWILSFGTIYVGYIIGGFIYDSFDKMSKKRRE